MLSHIIFSVRRILGPCCSTKFSRHRTVCEYFAALGLTLFVTNGIKNYVGYLRPIFYDICVPDEDYQTCTSEEVEDARKSFPSGHASISFCGLALLSFYLEGRFGISKLRVPTITSSSIDVERTRPSQHTIFFARVASVLSKSPLLLAIYIAASRVVDNKHFPADVVGGSAIGFSIALWIHGIWEETTL